MGHCYDGSVKTFYFKAVYARSIRIMVKKGNPNIKFEFYYSDSSSLEQTHQQESNTYISKTVLETIGGVEGGVETCKQAQGCWAGVETCEPREVKGFQIVYSDCGPNDKLTQVKVDYSMDGHRFECWNECKAVNLNGESFIFPTPLRAEKVRVHFTGMTGQPRFGIRFEWVN